MFLSAAPVRLRTDLLAINAPRVNNDQFVNNAPRVINISLASSISASRHQYQPRVINISLAYIIKLTYVISLRPVLA